MNQNKDPLILKIIVVGDPSVGKVSFIRQFVEGSFEQKYVMRIRVNFHIKEFENNGIIIRLFIMDIAGNEIFPSSYRIFFLGAAGALIIFDISNKDTLSNTKKWLESIHEYNGKIPILLVGNKSDLPDSSKIPKELINDVVQELNLPYIETSAKTGENVDEAFKKLTTMIVEEKNKK